MEYRDRPAAADIAFCVAAFGNGMTNDQVGCAPAFPGSDMDLKSLQREGLLPPQQHLTWHDDVPIIVLERGERAPCSAFPGLTQTQCDQINDAWHSFQVDLSHRSKYAQLRIVAGAGHRMHQEKPEAIAQAIRDVLKEVKQQKQ